MRQPLPGGTTIARNTRLRDPAPRDPGPVDPPSSSPARSGSLARAIQPTAAEVRSGRSRLHAKALAIGTLGLASYGALVFAPIGMAARVGCAVVLVIAVVASGTSIMHDANHGSFSRSHRSNRLVAYSADLLGASSWVWRFKHNTLHHTGTNVDGIDADIDQAPFARLAPQQPWRRWHRYQHVYMWVLYGFLTAKWLVLADVVALTRGGIGSNRFAHRPRVRNVAGVVAGKVVHVGWAVVVPLLCHPWWGVLAFYLACSWLVGFLLAMVFQLAHCTDEVEFLAAPARGAGEAFEARQLRTTADIRCDDPVLGPFLRWLMGGLDHQIEHHLAPRVPHTLYPRMATRLEALCRERGIAYHVHGSIWAAVHAHGRWLRQMGRRPAVE